MGDLSDLTGVIPPVQIQELENAPFEATYILPGATGGTGDFGNGDWTEIINTPAGFRGLVRSVTLFQITENFNSVTTEAQLNVGTAGDADAFAYTGNLGDPTATTSLTPALTYGVTKVIEPSTAVQVQGIAPTGGVPTGIASVAVTIQYFK
jgi:hypothetical protein